MTGDQLLQALVAQGLVSQEDSQKILREANLAGKTPEALLYERRTIDDEKIAQVKSQLLKIPFQRFPAASVEDSILHIIPEETARNYGVAPLSKQGDMFVVGMVNPDDPKAQEALKFIARQNRLNLGVYILTYGDWQQILRKYSPYKNQVEAAVKSLGGKADGKQKLVELDASGSSDDAPIIRIVADTLKEAVQGGASDIHIEPMENYMRIRFRSGGELHEITNLPLSLAQSVISRVKVMSNLKIDETRMPQDGRFRSRIFDREIDFRVATFPTPLGEKVAIRILDPKTGLKSLDKLGLMGKNLQTVKEGIEKPFGMVLISGPTGSGKSTTLYALLQLLNKEGVNIVSLEDPVEYFVAGVNQSQVRPEIGYTFASGLRQILRQDPDVIMVGEMRDDETAGLAVHAALTGHVVLSTLHTNNAAGVIPRLMDMKVEPFLLPSALNLMLSQRIVSKVCENCKQEEVASEALQKIIGQVLAGIPEEDREGFVAPYKIYHGAGCEVCKGKGTIGRMAIFEVLKMSPEMEDVVLNSPTIQKILAQGKKQGMVTMREDGVIKALKGLVTMEEVLRETE